MKKLSKQQILLLEFAQRVNDWHSIVGNARRTAISLEKRGLITVHQWPTTWQFKVTELGLKHEIQA